VNDVGRRLHAQLLAGPPAPDALAAVSRLVGVQAQSMPPARLAVRARTSGLTAADVDRAPLVRTWAMRGTLHLVPAADAEWLVELLGPVFRAANRRRRAQLGLDETTCERALPAIERILAAEGPLARADLVGRLARAGVHVDAATQAAPHLMLYAATSGLIARRTDDTYALLAEELRGVRANRPAQPVAELARRYLAAYAPADAADFAAWSGLPMAVARDGFDPGGPAAGPDTLGEPKLLGHWDGLLLGYRRRDLHLDPAHARAVQAGGGILRPIVLVDGRVAGTWRLERGVVTVEPFGRRPLESTLVVSVETSLTAEVADIGRFLGRSLEYRLAA
jgi:Winged helix DNA-binding domain